MVLRRDELYHNLGLSIISNFSLIIFIFSLSPLSLAERERENESRSLTYYLFNYLFNYLLGPTSSSGGTNRGLHSFNEEVVN